MLISSVNPMSTRHPIKHSFNTPSVFDFSRRMQFLHGASSALALREIFPYLDRYRRIPPMKKYSPEISPPFLSVAISCPSISLSPAFAAERFVTSRATRHSSNQSRREKKGRRLGDPVRGYNAPLCPPPFTSPSSSSFRMNPP
jgi:hypothetical protein